MEPFMVFFAAHPIIYASLYMLAGLAGMFVHFLKKDIKGQTFDDIKTYIAANFKYTLLATITTVAASIAAFATGQGIMAAFMAGYMFDSILNKDSSM